MREDVKDAIDEGTYRHQSQVRSHRVTCPTANAVGGNIGDFLCCSGLVRQAD